MKKLFIILQVAMLSFIVSCKKETLPVPAQQSQTITLDSASKILSTCNKWVVTSYLKGGIDYTANFNMTGLYFCPDNFTVGNDIMSQSGKWFFSKPQDNLYLNISFNSEVILNPVWQGIQDDWLVNDFQPNYMVLQSGDRTRRITIRKLER